MTVRTAELLIAIVLAFCSIGLMIKSAELNIGWIEGKGPGSGAWPFWLSAGMLGTCIWTIVRWFRRITPESRSLELYMTRDTVLVVGVSALAILGLLIGIQFLGIYISLVVFLLFYIRFIGHHTWALTISLAICIPFFIFCLFEVALTIPLPKAITDPAFYPVYDLIYARSFKEQLATLSNSIVLIPLLAVLGVILYWGKRWFTRSRVAKPDALDTNHSDAELSDQQLNERERLDGEAG